MEAACAAFVTDINARVHRTTGRRPVEMLTQERPALHAVPDLPHTAALGVTRRVPDNTPMVTFEHCQYSLPATLLGHTVWIRHHDGTDEVVISALDDGGPMEVARHQRATPGSPAIDDSHFPEHRDKIPGDYRVRARTVSEQTFLALGPGAAVWLKEAAAVGTERILQKMAHAVELSALAGRADVDWALGHAAVHGRFATGDLDSILASKGVDPTRRGAGEDISLAQGTSGPPGSEVESVDDPHDESSWAPMTRCDPPQDGSGVLINHHTGLKLVTQPRKEPPRALRHPRLVAATTHNYEHPSHHCSQERANPSKRNTYSRCPHDVTMPDFCGDRATSWSSSSEVKHPSARSHPWPAARLA